MIAFPRFFYITFYLSRNLCGKDARMYENTPLNLAEEQEGKYLQFQPFKIQAKVKALTV